MISHTVKMTGDYKGLLSGHIYEVSEPDDRMVEFRDIAPSDILHLYIWEVEYARASGRMYDHDDTQSVQMQSDIASSICAHLPSKFIY